jgi:heparan-alpha-glucosaminide N-acetyltransferase
MDAYRGFVMFLMMAEVLWLDGVARALPESGFWAFLAHQQDHVAWVGCSLHDLIQPSFSFLVGVALPFSLAARLGRGLSPLRLRLHAVWRAFALVALGIFLRSVGAKQSNFTFEDTLTQIGLGYLFLFLLGERSVKVQGTALAVILVGYWALFACSPLPGPDFDWQQAGASADWNGNLTGFAAHWNKNTNPAWAFDTWFLNLFPRQQPFIHNAGGYATLSFLPTLGTMILGLIAGGWLRSGLLQRDLFRRLVLAGFAGLALGWLLNATGVCPNVKRIWTPSWVLFSGGWCFLLLAAFHFLTEARGWRAWAFPLVVIGANSIAAYCIAHLTVGFIDSSLHTHVSETFFLLLGAPYKPLLFGGCVLLIEWSILFWMYRRRIFLKI